MPTSLANNRVARDAVLARVRKALGKDDPELKNHTGSAGE